MGWEYGSNLFSAPNYTKADISMVICEVCFVCVLFFYLFFSNDAYIFLVLFTFETFFFLFRFRSFISTANLNSTLFFRIVYWSKRYAIPNGKNEKKAHKKKKQQHTRKPNENCMCLSKKQHKMRDQSVRVNNLSLIENQREQQQQNRK